MKAKEVVGNTAIDTANFILTSPPTLSRFLQEDPIGYEDQTNLYLYVRSNPLRYTDPSGMKTKEVLNRVVAGTAVGVTFVGFGAASLVNRDFGYGAEFLSNSIIGVNDSEYYPGSKYISDFMQTKTYSNLRKDITAEVYKGNTSSQGSLSFDDTMTMLTLGKYNYTSVATQSDNLYKITTTITDVYDFNKEKDNGTWLNDYLNVMHSANEYGMLTPYTTKIVIEDTIPLK